MNRFFRKVVLTLWLSVVFCSTGRAEEYDVLIRNGFVLDGTGVAAKMQDVAIKGDRIAAIGDLSDDTARRLIDASGFYVTPGFIDVHSHAASGLKKKSLSAANSILLNGVTTVMISPDGGGPLDLKKERAELEAAGVGVNVAQLIGHGSIRKKFFGIKDIQPNAKQLEEIAFLEKAAKKGLLDAIDMQYSPVKRPLDFQAHGHWYTNEWVSSDVIIQFLFHSRPDERGLKRKPDSEAWYFPIDYPDTLKKLIAKSKREES